MTTNRRLPDMTVEFHPSTFPVCPKCHRADCDLTATVIIGERNWHQAVGECIREQRAQHFARLREAGIV